MPGLLIDGGITHRAAPAPAPAPRETRSADRIERDALVQHAPPVAHKHNGLLAALNAAAARVPRQPAPPPVVDATATEVRRVWAEQGTDAALARLDAMTANQSAQANAATLVALQPVLEIMGRDLAGRARRIDTTNTRQADVAAIRRYRDAVGHLSAVAGRAALAESGAAAVQATAAALVDDADPEAIYGLDEALGAAVRTDGSAALALEVAAQLEARDGHDAANAVLKDVRGGLDTLRQDLGDSVDALLDDEVFQLVQGYTVFVAPGRDPAVALQNWLDTHPEQKAAYDEKLATLDRQAAAAVRAEQSLAGVAGMEKALDKFNGDADVAFALGASGGAGRQIDRVLQSPSAAEAFIGRLEGLEGDAAQALGGRVVRARLAQAVELTRDGRTSEADRVMQSLQGHGGLVGLDDRAFDPVVAALRNTLDVALHADADGARVVEALGGVDKALDAWGDAPETRSVRLAAFGLSALGLGSSVAALGDGDVDAQEVLVTMASTLDFGQSTVELLLPDAKFTKSVAWDGLSRSLIAFNTAMDLLSAGRNFDDGDAVMGGLDLVSAGGGGLALWTELSSSTAVAGWVGPAIVLAASAAKAGWGHWRDVQKSNRLEDEGTVRYLHDLGFREDVAGELVNADSQGRSALPALAALARAEGWDLSQPQGMQGFIDWLNAFGGNGHRLDLLGRLVEQAHHVGHGPGGLTVEMTQRESDRLAYNNSLGNDTLDKFHVESVEGLQRWAHAAFFSDGLGRPAAERAPEVPVSG